MAKEYLVWTPRPIKHSFVLHKMSHVPKKYQIVKGFPRAESFPAGVTHSVDPDYPNDILLMDTFRSPNRVTLVSSRMRGFLEDVRKLKKVEFLPITIIDHKGKVAGEFFILHPIDPPDCLDFQESNAKRDALDRDCVYEIERIAIDTQKVDSELELFKIRHLYDQIIVEKHLASAIDQQGFTGVSWTGLDDFHRP